MKKGKRGQRSERSIKRQRKDKLSKRLDARKEISSVLNLSRLRLTRAQVDALNKGLGFVPTPTADPQIELTEFRRRVRLMLTFGFDSKPKPAFHLKTGFDPGYLYEYPEAEHFLQTFMKDLQEKLSLITASKPRRPNFHPLEYAGIRELANNPNVVIKPADKSSKIVIMNKEDYLKEGYRQLQNLEYYAPLLGSVRDHTIPKLIELFRGLYREGHIDRKTRAFLMPPKDCSHRHFYLLPKEHKPREEWPGVLPKGRPITANVNTELTNPSKWLDSFLQPPCQNLWQFSLVKDSYDFVAKLRAVKVPASTQVVLLAADVQDLYTNVPWDGARKAVEQALQSHVDRDRPPTERLLALLDLVLQNNDMEFDGRFFLQTKGIAMGNPVGPTVANLFMAQVDDVVRAEQPLGYWRFIDDLFVILDSSRHDLAAFQDRISRVDPNIKLTFSASTERNTFLDVEVLATRAPEGFLTYKVYFKPTDTRQLLHYRSYHPKHTHRGVLLSQIIRYQRLCCRQTDVEAAINSLFEICARNGYPQSLMSEVKQEALTRGSQLADKSNLATTSVLPLVIQYDDRLTEIPAWIHEKWETFLDEYPFMVPKLPKRLTIAWKGNRKLRSEIVRTTAR